MKKKNMLITAFAALMITTTLAQTTSAQDRANRFGGGFHYWRTIEQIKEDKEFRSDGISWLISYQRIASLLKLELGAEIFPNGYYGAKDTTVAPQAFVGLSTPIYAALGIATACAGDIKGTFSKPFYILRAGLDLELLPGIYIDLNANYYFTDWNTIENVNTDTITLGGQLRFAF